MDGAALAPMQGTDQAWTAATASTLRGMISAKESPAIEQFLVDEIHAAKLKFGYAPPLRSVFWSILGGETSVSDRISECFEAFQAINQFVFQTLQTHLTFRELLEGTGLNTARATTEIWVEWRDTNLPASEAAQKWLDKKHRELGLGKLF